MSNPFPPLDVAGFTQRTAMPPSDVATVVANRPGYIERRIAVAFSRIKSATRKRYGDDYPLSVNPPPIWASGTTPPAASYTGVPMLGSMALVLLIVATGAIGAATFNWSIDGGRSFVGSLATPTIVNPGLGYVTAPTVTFPAPPPGGVQATGTATIANGSVTGITMTANGSGYTGPVKPTFTPAAGDPGQYAAAVANTVPIPVTTSTSGNALPGTGLVVNWGPLGTFGADNAYTSPPPVVEVVLGWITTIITPEVYRARGGDPSGDAQLKELDDDRLRVLGTDSTKGELREAADGENGLLDLPMTDIGASAQVTGGPFGYSETSPYVGMERQRRRARCEDSQGTGTGDDFE